MCKCSVLTDYSPENNSQPDFQEEQLFNTLIQDSVGLFCSCLESSFVSAVGPWEHPQKFSRMVAIKCWLDIYCHPL
ncbi:hypothetical protein MRX96_038897 [Rhipicephalus microplus]